MVASAVNERPVTLWTLADGFAPLTVKQMLSGRMPDAAMEHCNDLKKQYFGASKYQRNLLDVW